MQFAVLNMWAYLYLVRSKYAHLLLRGAVMGYKEHLAFLRADANAYFASSLTERD
jgi:hypothetical protein